MGDGACLHASNKLSLAPLALLVQVTAVVFLAEEAGLAIVAALHDVQRHAIEVNAWATGQVRMLAKLIRA